MDRSDVTESIKQAPQSPKRAGATKLESLLAGRSKPKELPPWLVVGNRVVMRWGGRHHVARVGDEDPFEAAKKMYERLLSA